MLYIPSGLVRTSTAASTFAGLPVSGRSEDRREMTLNNWVRRQLGAANHGILEATYNRLDSVYR